jgi:hypothetical protein
MLEWFESDVEKVGLARHLVDQGILNLAMDVVDFFAKPQRWTPEHVHYAGERDGTGGHLVLEPATCTLCRLEEE